MVSWYGGTFHLPIGPGSALLLLLVFTHSSRFYTHNTNLLVSALTIPVLFIKCLDFSQKNCTKNLKNKKNSPEDFSSELLYIGTGTFIILYTV